MFLPIKKVNCGLSTYIVNKGNCELKFKVTIVRFKVTINLFLFYSVAGTGSLFKLHKTYKLTCSWQSSSTSRGLVQWCLVEGGLRNIVLLRFKMHHRQHGVHHPWQRVFNNHVYVIPATSIHVHPMNQHTIFHGGKLQRQTITYWQH